MNNWGLGPGKYLLIKYDENLFWLMVISKSEKACAAIGLDPVPYHLYHSRHINKVMCVTVNGI